MTENTNVASSWLEALAARGVRLSVRNGRLRMYPQQAYKDLSDDERAVLRHHRDEIKALVVEGETFVWSPDVTAQKAPAAEPLVKAVPTAAPALEPCPYCHRTCVGKDHFAFEGLHWDDPEQQKRRDDDATAVMFESIRRQRMR